MAVPDQETYRTLREVFGFERFRDGQEAVVRTLLNGGNAMAVMPTGSGKSLCYQLPALLLDGLTIVVSPLVALMQDQVAALRLAGVPAETINSTRDRPDNVAAWRRVAAGETRLLYLSPERLMTERMLAALERLPVRMIVVDEAHCISQWGPAFRPEYEALSRLQTIFPDATIGAFTATADEVTRNDILAKLFAGQARSFVHGFDRPNIRLGVALKRNWQSQMLEFLDAHAGESGIVYCLSRKKTEAIAGLLADRGLNALPYHAGLDKSVREANQNRFMTDPGVVMVATIAFGMGIDKPDVRFVLHTDLPSSVEAYYQEFGRAGRDGAPAEALMLYGLDDIRMRRVFVEQEDSDPERRRREHKRLDALIAYCEAAECRRRMLLGYFGETADPCGHCDTCLEPVELVDGSEAGQKALSAVLRTGQKFGAAHIADVLRGADTDKIRSFGHDALACYGVGTDLARNEWLSILRQLVAGRFLDLDIQGYGGLRLGPRGQGLVHGDEAFRYRRDTLPKARRRREQPVDTTLPPPDTGLLGKLKALRLEIAKTRGVPAYVVFPDRALDDMARRRPTNLDQFADCHGVGAAKLERFGEAFVALIAGAVAEEAPGEDSQ